ncbi:hypothetical protein C2E20_8316 [Micractinium conductrix]|uniref:Uncharacterized protein n=1 Tax=Micractinium conductrix TaxID=554055 RepID=A0A2P6V1S6_9CHLO|nr:hypothetical protein C2E20_8316 [Micractinium conductrix]|eukprot:PSC68047.1 hypothetical protein C2E20_8316 [Micractinium conductrix]
MARPLPSATHHNMVDAAAGPPACQSGLNSRRLQARFEDSTAEMYKAAWDALCCVGRNTGDDDGAKALAWQALVCLDSEAVARYPAASQWTSDTQQCLEVLHFVSECGLAETAGRTARHLARPCCVLFSHVLDGARGDAEALRLKVEASMREGAPKLVASIDKYAGGAVGETLPYRTNLHEALPKDKDHLFIALTRHKKLQAVMSLVRDRVQAQVGAQLQAAQPLLLHYATCDIHVEPGVEALVDGLLGSCGEMMKLAGDATSYGALWGNRQCGLTVTFVTGFAGTVALVLLPLSVPLGKHQRSRAGSGVLAPGVHQQTRGPAAQHHQKQQQRHGVPNGQASTPST